MNRIKYFFESKGYFAIVFVIFTLSVIACEKFVIEGPERPENVSFKENLIPIFTSNCTSCHGGANSPNLKAELAYNSLISGGYVSVENSGESKLYKVLLERHKTYGEKLIKDPKSDSASYYLKDYILVWIEEGAENN